MSEFENLTHAEKENKIRVYPRVQNKYLYLWKDYVERRHILDPDFDLLPNLTFVTYMGDLPDQYTQEDIC